MLNLPRRVRTALVQAGCSGVADVQFLMEQGVLERVRNIGPICAELITERMRRWAAQQTLHASE